MKDIASWAIAIAAALLAACAPVMPEVRPTEKSVWLPQNWTQEQRTWFHHASQGTATLPLPYEWLLALERPELKVFGEPGLFTDSEYLLRFGFIPSPSSAHNPAGLPVGFAIDNDFTNPATGKAMHAIGFTCAACHTGFMNYKGTQIRVDGGPALTDLTKLTRALGVAMAYTQYVPFRFERFARRVLGKEYSAENSEKLKQEFIPVFQKLRDAGTLEDGVAPQSVEEGFSRLDALNRIGNQVFGIGFKPGNYHPFNAPVSYPKIWSASWYDWVQYDGSIMQPMVRNAGEALGVLAGANLAGPHATRFASTVRVDVLHAFEKQLAGDPPPAQNRRYNGLRPPKWPEHILGSIDRVKAKEGRDLYVKRCQGCHLPPTDSDAFWSERHWVQQVEAGQRYLHLVAIPIPEIGTDPMQATGFAQRTVDTVGMGLNTRVYTPDETGRCQSVLVKDGPAVPYGLALGAVVQETVNYWYDKNGIGEADRTRMNGFRQNCLVAAAHYVARPLEGVWATAPYLHNGSVPNLYALLSPARERPATFYLGNPEFDPVNVGYETKEFSNGFKLDTTLKGNSNRGHEFDAAPKGNGVIGPLLAPEERLALIEYLKTQ